MDAGEGMAGAPGDGKAAVAPPAAETAVANGRGLPEDERHVALALMSLQQMGSKGGGDAAGEGGSKKEKAGRSPNSEQQVPDTDEQTHSTGSGEGNSGGSGSGEGGQARDKNSNNSKSSPSNINESTSNASSSDNNNPGARDDSNSPPASADRGATGPTLSANRGWDSNSPPASADRGNDGGGGRGPGGSVHHISSHSSSHSSSHQPQLTSASDLARRNGDSGRAYGSGPSLFSSHGTARPQQPVRVLDQHSPVPQMPSSEPPPKRQRHDETLQVVAQEGDFLQSNTPANSPGRPRLLGNLGSHTTPLGIPHSRPTLHSQFDSNPDLQILAEGPIRRTSLRQELGIRNNDLRSNLLPGSNQYRHGSWGLSRWLNGK